MRVTPQIKTKMNQYFKSVKITYYILYKNSETCYLIKLLKNESYYEVDRKKYSKY